MAHYTTLRLATVDVQLGDDRGNVLQETIMEITTVDESLGPPTVTQHALNQGLGNNGGRFDMKYTGFMSSARRVTFSSGLLSAELLTNRSEWKNDKIALRAKATYSSGSWTHELIIVDNHDPTLEKAMSAIHSGLGSLCWNLRLSVDGALIVIYLVCDSSTGFQSRCTQHATCLNHLE